eukprot:s1222_g6.t1
MCTNEFTQDLRELFPEALHGSAVDEGSRGSRSRTARDLDELFEQALSVGACTQAEMSQKHISHERVFGHGKTFKDPSPEKTLRAEPNETTLQAVDGFSPKSPDLATGSALTELFDAAFGNPAGDTGSSQGIPLPSPERAKEVRPAAQGRPPPLPSREVVAPPIGDHTLDPRQVAALARAVSEEAPAEATSADTSRRPSEDASAFRVELAESLCPAASTCRVWSLVSA